MTLAVSVKIGTGLDQPAGLALHHAIDLEDRYALVVCQRLHVGKQCLLNIVLIKH